jgi:hypothetical protein
MAKAKKIVRREWTKDEKISKSLKRTPGATSVMAAKLGVSLSMRA